MAGCREISGTFLKEEKREIANNIEDKKEDIRNSNISSNAKRYPKYELLSVRNTQLSLQYPQCALRPELQALPIWSCRLRCELQYLGFWKVSNTGNLSGCNGNCQSYTCDGHLHPASCAQVNIHNSQMGFGNIQQSQQSQPPNINSSPTLNNKKAVRSRDRFLSYQRCINTELVRGASPNGGDDSIKHFNEVKPTFIDHRSISSSHLMPAFAKRRMGHTNLLQSEAEACSNFSNNDGHNKQHSYNENEKTKHFEGAIKPQKDSKVADSQNDYQFYKTAPNSRLDKNDQLADNRFGWMNIVNKTFSDLSTPNNRVNNTSSINKKSIYERRIGSGRLVPREVNWDIRTANSKQIDKERTNILNSNGEKVKVNPAGEVDKLSNSNSLFGRYLDQRIQDRHMFERRMSNSEDSNIGGGSSNASKRHIMSSSDSKYHQSTPHFTGQRSMSFRRREYVDHKDHLRDFFEPKETRDCQQNREKGGEQNHHHNHQRDRKEEPEWFSEGPTSQHDTIELRGFDETEESLRPPAEISPGQYASIKMNSSESVLLIHDSNSNMNFATKENTDISSDVSNNSTITTSTLDKDIDSGSCCTNGNVDESMKSNKIAIDLNETKIDAKQIVSKSEVAENTETKRSNVTGVDFDDLINLDAIEDSLIGGTKDQTFPASIQDNGTSRFSRWFLKTSNSNVQNNDELNNNSAKKEDLEQLNKDINDSDLHSFMSFLKYNNFPAPELPKVLPSNVSAVSVEELEARMRQMDSGEFEKSKKSSPVNQTDICKFKSESDTTSQPTELNTRDVEAFRKLLDQLGKARADISTNHVLPNIPGRHQSVTTQGVAYTTGMPTIPPPSSLPHSNTPKQEYMMKVVHHQQKVMNHHQHNSSKMVPTLLPHNSPRHRLSPKLQNENMSSMSASHHSHIDHATMITGHPQKRIDEQHLIQSLARGQVSLNFLEHELNKLSKINDSSASGVFKENSRCCTPLASSLNAASIPANGSIPVPISPHMVPVQNAAVTSDCVSSVQPVCAMLRSHHREEGMQYMPSQREMHMYSQAIIQKKLETEQQEVLRNRQEIHKQPESVSASISQSNRQQSLKSNSTLYQQENQQSPRHINSPTLAFTPTSVLRKMTAEKETTSSCTAAISTSPQQIQPLLQNPHLKMSTNSQISYQHSNQPRMILGGGNVQYMHQQQHNITQTANGNPQISPDQKPQIRNENLGSVKWPIMHSSMESNHSAFNSMSNKPLGRPILKGPGPIQTLLTQSAQGALGQNRTNVNQNSQTVSQFQKLPGMHHPSRQIAGQQFSTNILQNQIPISQQAVMKQQSFQQQQQQRCVMQRQQIQPNSLVNHAPLPPSVHHSACNDNNSVTNLNYRRDGGLSPTSNQLAQWFSPELLAQASAGKLPLLNMNQALSLEEFERSIQHSSSAVNN